jgi:hypothetical protein
MGNEREDQMPMTPETDYFGYSVREPYPGESQYFKANPNVSGMAAEDDRIIFNPYSKGVNRDAVGRNEAVRLWLRQHKVTPDFGVTEAQTQQFRGTPYEGDLNALRSTILGRIISGDPSAGDITEQQRAFAESVLKRIKGLEP